MKISVQIDVPIVEIGKFDHLPVIELRQTMFWGSCSSPNSDNKATVSKDTVEAVSTGAGTPLDLSFRCEVEDQEPISSENPFLHTPHLHRIFRNGGHS